MEDLIVRGLTNLIEFQIENGTMGIVPCGTTGESATLTHDEHHRVIEITVKTVKGRVPVIAGTGSNSTREALDLTKAAKKLGADAALVITPYYNKPTQEGLYKHYKLLAEKGGLPIVIYNVPSRTGVNIAPDTVARLSRLKNIVAIKEATGSLDYVSELRSKSNITIISGNDSLNLPILSVGGMGVISVLANIAPKESADLIDSYLAGNTKKAERLHRKLFPLNKALFIETNPIPVKTALQMMGMITGEMRLPLSPMQPENKAVLKAVMKKTGIL